MLFWRPHPDNKLVFYVIAGLWGVGDAVWQTQINGKSTKKIRLHILCLSDLFILNCNYLYVLHFNIVGLYGMLFRRNKEAAFSNYRLWESAGFVIAYAYSTTLCARMKLYVLFGNLVLGVIGYVIVEIRHRRKVNFKANIYYMYYCEFNSKFKFTKNEKKKMKKNNSYLLYHYFFIFLLTDKQERRLKKQEAKEHAAREAEAAKQQDIEETDDEKDDLEEDIEITHF